MQVSSKQLKEILISIADNIEKNVDYLTELDAKIGDGDHGVNMNKGFKKIKEKLQKTSIDDTGEMLILSGKVLLNEIGGAMGPLYGGGFVKAGTVLKGKTSLDKNDIGQLFTSFLESVKSLGQAKVGDKTMVDTLQPFVKEYQDQVKKNGLLETFKLALDKGREGMESTKEMVSKVGRSSRLLERSKGHLDVGSVSSYIVLESFYNKLKELKG
ncbi:MAG: dihydroxyacetone kinase subunit DhaL [Candidatus Humimicrobiaceae bacterium]